jgi:hypothetical protein
LRGAGRGSRRTTTRGAAIAALLSLLLGAAPAEARSVTVRWRCPNPEPGRIAGFRLYTRHLDQPYGRGLDVGLPPEQDGVYRYSLEVSDTDATYVSVTAYDARGRESPRSNERLYLLPEP